jgi:hypothetical protein
MSAGQRLLLRGIICEDRQTYRSVEQLGGADNTTMKLAGQRFLGMAPLLFRTYPVATVRSTALTPPARGYRSLVAGTYSRTPVNITVASAMTMRALNKRFALTMRSEVFPRK